MTRKRILDITSTKKRDTMVGFTQSQSSAGRYFVELLSADNFMLWCPTSRLSAGRGYWSAYRSFNTQRFLEGVLRQFLIGDRYLGSMVVASHCVYYGSAL